MTTPLPVNSSLTITNNILRTIKNGMVEASIASGITNPVSPDVSLGSFVGLLARGVANEVSTATSTISTALDLQMPDTATGAALDRWLNLYNIPRRVAAPAYGTVSGQTSPTSATAFIPAGTQLTGPTGLRYAVLTNGTYGNGSNIVVYSIDLGTQCDLEGGSTLQWVVPPSYFSSTVIVSTTNPITGASDPEDDGTARQRLLAFLADPPSSGNPSQIIDFATSSDPSVQTAFVSPAARGPGSIDVAVVGYAGATTPERNVDPTILTNVIAPYISGNMTSAVDVEVFNVVNYSIDVVLNLSLPYPATASPPGPGGGWLDPNPFGTGWLTGDEPAVCVEDGYALSGNTSGVPQNTPNAFWISMPASMPLASGPTYSVSYLSPTDYTLYSAITSGTVISYSSFPSLSGYTNLYYITLSSPFYDSATTGGAPKPGCLIFPTAANTAKYVADFLAYITNMGPGERTANVSLLPRAYRQPAEALAYNYIINSRCVKPVLDSGPEVYDGTLSYVGFYGIDYTATDAIPNGPSITNAVSFLYYSYLTPANPDPAYYNVAPPTAFIHNGNYALGPSYIFVLNNFAIYQL